MTALILKIIFLTGVILLPFSGIEYSIPIKIITNLDILFAKRHIQD